MFAFLFVRFRFREFMCPFLFLAMRRFNFVHLSLVFLSQVRRAFLSYYTAPRHTPQNGGKMARPVAHDVGN